MSGHWQEFEISVGTGHSSRLMLKIWSRPQLRGKIFCLFPEIKSEFSIKTWYQNHSVYSMMPSIVILFCFPLDAVWKQKADKILRTEMLEYENARWEPVRSENWRWIVWLKKYGIIWNSSRVPVNQCCKFFQSQSSFLIYPLLFHNRWDGDRLPSIRAKSPKQNTLDTLIFAIKKFHTVEFIM